MCMGLVCAYLYLGRCICDSDCHACMFRRQLGSGVFGNQQDRPLVLEWDDDSFDGLCCQPISISHFDRYRNSQPIVNHYHRHYDRYQNCQ